MGEYDDACRRLIALICPKCSASNRPGATLIEREQNGSATCAVCAHNWMLKEKD